MKRFLVWLCVALLCCGMAWAEERPEQLERQISIEGEEESVVYTRLDDAQGRFSLYIDPAVYTAAEEDGALVIRALDNEDAYMTLRVLPGEDAGTLSAAAYAAYSGSDDSFWQEEFEEPVHGYGMIGDDPEDAEKVRSCYWFEMPDGTLLAEFSLYMEGMEGHGVRMWDMLDTLSF